MNLFTRRCIIRSLWDLVMEPDVVCMGCGERTSTNFSMCQKCGVELSLAELTSESPHDIYIPPTKQEKTEIDLDEYEPSFSTSAESFKEEEIAEGKTGRSLIILLLILTIMIIFLEIISTWFKNYLDFFIAFRIAGIPEDYLIIFPVFIIFSFIIIFLGLWSWTELIITKEQSIKRSYWLLPVIATIFFLVGVLSLAVRKGRSWESYEGTGYFMKKSPELKKRIVNVVEEIRSLANTLEHKDDMPDWVKEKFGGE